MYVYVRHYYKEYSNGKNDIFPFDPQILPDRAGAIPALKRQLIATYGLPKAIFCSPYERTRQTARLLAPDGIPIVVDYNLSEYIGKHHDHKLVDGSLRPQTIKHSPPATETKTDLANRVKQHLSSREKMPQAVYWFITHGLVIKRVLSFHQESYYPKPLEAVVIDPSGVYPPLVLST